MVREAELYRICRSCKLLWLACTVMRSGTRLYQNIFTVKTFSYIGVISIEHYIVHFNVDQSLDNKVVFTTVTDPS